MRSLAFAALLSILVSHSVADQPAEPNRKVAQKSKSDQELFEGIWLIIGLEANGKAEPEQNYKGNTLTFTKDKATLKEGKHAPIEFGSVLDPSKLPKTIDLMAKAVVIRGIYKFEGEELVLCLSIGANRPTEFATKPGGDTEIFTLKRSRWERHTDKLIGFSVEMPGKPEERKREVTTPAGKATTTIQVVRSEAERVSYLTSVTPFPGPLDEKELAAALEAVKTSLLAEVDSDAKATTESEKDIKIGGQPVKELLIGLEVLDSKDKGAARVRLFASGDRLYGLMVIGTEEGVKAANVSRFWNSFRLGEKKKN
ncbi:MAG: TIGR03067 domain-containing protein [Planctomycetes bacterium]|nr:TIGR03067 domain-containing protein [Planctomycetota bacterium]